MSYTRNYEIRYNDMDNDGYITDNAMLEMFQDISICDVEDTKYNTQGLKELGLAWLISGWSIELKEKIAYPEKVAVTTEVIRLDKVQGLRQYRITAGGKILCVAKCSWFLFDFNKMRIAKLLPEMYEQTELFEDKCEFEYKKLKDEETEDLRDFTVIKRDIDTNGHLNNVKGYEYLKEALPKDYSYSHIDINYKVSAHFGDKMVLSSKQTEDGLFAKLSNVKNQTIVMCKFI